MSYNNNSHSIIADQETIDKLLVLFHTFESKELIPDAIMLIFAKLSNTKTTHGILIKRNVFHLLKEIN